jgi:hypothetical protein
MKIDLNYDRDEETIRLYHVADGEDFTLRINNAEIKGKFNYAYSSDLQIIDMYRNDNLKEVIVKGYGNSDETDMFFYQYIDGKIVEVGHLPSNFGVETDGNGTLTEHAWMGFWTIRIRYDFNTRKKTLTKIHEEFYDVNLECEVNNSFKLLRDRDDNSETAAMLKPKTKLTIVKADVSPVCKTPDGYDDSFFCDWYFIKASDGSEGWVRLKDFYEKVDGLIWAG